MGRREPPGGHPVPDRPVRHAKPVSGLRDAQQFVGRPGAPGGTVGSARHYRDRPSGGSVDTGAERRPGTAVGTIGAGNDAA